MEVDYAHAVRRDTGWPWRIATMRSCSMATFHDLTGLDIVNRLRTEARVATPIIMVTGRDKLEDKIVDLERGVDDYLTKPFATRELEARLRAVIRRNRRESGARSLQW